MSISQGRINCDCFLFVKVEQLSFFLKLWLDVAHADTYIFYISNHLLLILKFIRSYYKYFKSLLLSNQLNIIHQIRSDPE